MTASEQLVAFATIVIKEITRFTRIWQQSVLQPAVSTSLYFVIFGSLIGSRIGQMGGVPYMDFIVPGLILMGVITNSYMNTASSLFSAKFQHSIEEVLVSPTPNYLVLLGYVAGGVARGFLVAVVVAAVATLFSDLRVHNFAVLLTTVSLTAVLFALAGFVNGMLARTFDDLSTIPSFVLTPLTYLGGIFYSISSLPEQWQLVSLVNPILYMINAFRYGFLGITDISLFVSYGIILAFIAVLFGFNLRLLQRGHGLRT